MFRKVWHIVKALMGRQDGRVPADPALHLTSLAQTSAAIRLSVEAIAAAASEPAAAPVQRRACPLPAGQSLRQPTLSIIAGEIASEPLPAPTPPAAKPLKRALLARRLSTVGKLNGPVSARRSGRKTVAPAGKPVPRASKPRAVRAAKPAAWIVAGRAKTRAAAGQKTSQQPTARVIAFPVGRVRSAARPARNAA